MKYFYNANNEYDETLKLIENLEKISKELKGMESSIKKADNIFDKARKIIPYFGNLGRIEVTYKDLLKSIENAIFSEKQYLRGIKK